MTKVYLFDLLKNNIDINFFFSCLPESFKERTNKYSLKEDKKRSVIAYYLLYKYLINDFSYDFSKMNLKENEYEKPYLEGIYFNISHSHNFVVLVISDYECGIDIEKIESNKDYSKIAKKVLKNNEYQEYLITKNNEYVIKKWVLMEAYYKMLGTGIKYNDMEIDVDDNYEEVEITNKQYEKYYIVIFYKCDIIDITNVEM